MQNPSHILFKGRYFAVDILSLCAYWYLRYAFSYHSFTFLLLFEFPLYGEVARKRADTDTALFGLTTFPHKRSPVSAVAPW